MSKKYRIFSFYCFASIHKESLLEIKNKFLEFAKDDLTGLIVLGEEGIYGTVCGSISIINKLKCMIEDLLDSRNINIKESSSLKKIFKKLKVKIKPEIVTMGVSKVNPNLNKGIYVDAHDWNRMLEDKNTLVIDTRNHYEVSLGTFKNSINPETNNFREFPKWVEMNLEKYLKKNNFKNIAMFCTGGIRCEKATSLLKNKGYENVFHLKGGILKYLENIPSQQSLYNGECYVFDERVSLNHNLEEGSYTICHACGMPLSEEDKNRDLYIEGIQCHRCLNKFTDEDRRRFADRQKQIEEKKFSTQ